MSHRSVDFSDECYYENVYSSDESNVSLPYEDNSSDSESINSGLKFILFFLLRTPRRIY